MRAAIAWTAGIATCGGAYLILTTLLHKIGIPSYISFDAPRMVSSGLAEYEISGASTDPGFAAVVFSFFSGIMAGTWIAARLAGARWWSKSQLECCAFLGGAALFGVMTAILYKLLGQTSGFIGLIHDALDIGAAVVAFLIVRPWYRERLKRLSN